MLNRENVNTGSDHRLENVARGHHQDGVALEAVGARSRASRDGYFTRPFRERAVLTLILLWLFSCLNQTQAQTITTLIQFTNVWKYDQSGLELGTAWRTNGYNDYNWPSGAGSLGFDTTPAVWTVHAPIVTPLTISPTVTSYYFRTTFQFSGTTNGLSLFASNLVDDGCVIYLNGFQAGRLRVSQNQNAATSASVGTEGQIEVLGLTNVARLRKGENLLAVEVHQSSLAKEDVMWGMKLVAVEQLPLTITNQPQDQIVSVGDTVTFQVGVSGGPAFYQWQKDGVNLVNGSGISGATSNVLRIASAQPDIAGIYRSAGIYRVLVTNAVTTSLVSSLAVLTVKEDGIGPMLVSAVIRLDSGSTNQILVTFSESVPNQFNTDNRAVNPANYRLTVCGTTNTVPITNVTASGTLVLLRFGNTNWNIDGCYVLTVNNIPDIRGNIIAPNSQIGVSRPRRMPVLDSDDPWRFHNSALFEPGIADDTWFTRDFPESSWWADGTSCFYFLLSGSAPCAGALSTHIGFQPEPALLRTWFNWPIGLPTPAATLRPRFAVDDGAVFYLNGVEVYRHNMPAGSINSTSKAATIVGTPTCVTNLGWSVTNLVSGSNCLAVAVFQAGGAADADIVFCFELDVDYLETPPLPPEPEPSLAITPLNLDAVRLWWTGGGYALESATNLTVSSASYPLGPWQQVTNMSNPYTNSLASPTRFFRLKK